MKILINSHKKSSIALNHLLDSMKIHDEFKNFEIIICIGGFNENSDYKITVNDNIKTIECNYNSIDYNGLICLSELFIDNIDEHYFYLHDTCKVGPNFFSIIKSIDLNNVTSIKINKNFSMNIGIYSQKIINSFKNYLLQFKNIDENKNMIEFKGLMVCNEDYIFKNDSNNILFNNYDGWNYTGPTDYYNTGTLRIVEYYNNFDIYKIKANWGQFSYTVNV